MCGGEIFKPIQVTRKMSDYSDDDDDDEEDEESQYHHHYGTNHI